MVPGSAGRTGVPPAAPSQSVQPYVTGLTAWNGDTYSVGLPPFNYTLMPFKYTNTCVTQHPTYSRAK